MTQIPQHITDAIFARVRRDLTPGNLVVAAKTGLAVFVGGLLSLMVCAQFGIGFTGFSVELSHKVHVGTNSFVCALFCGAIFAVLPAVVLRLISSAMQFRYMLKKKWQVPVLWLVTAGALFSYHGSFGGEFINFFGWMVAAWITYRVIAGIVDYGSEISQRISSPTT